MTTALARQLLSARNSDGGWPYYAGKASRLEPTAWALMALQAAGEPVSAEPFAAWPRRDGWFLDRTSDEVNISFNALVAVALVTLGAPAGLTAPLAERLVAAKGERIAPSTINRQDNTLQGWPWTAGTFSWVEPTAWGLLALKRLHARGPDAVARIAEAERLMADRVCKEGGWNHGNANMLGAELSPYQSVSALGLIALADRRADTWVERTLGYLSAHKLDEHSAMALGLTAIALTIYGLEARDVLHALDEDRSARSFLGNLHATSMAIYAGAAAGNGYEAFRV